MCGIFGIADHRGRFSDDFLEKAGGSLAHRGPDDSGTVMIENRLHRNFRLGFAHTRLSIIDLSALGHQPMQDPITDNWIVFNGEIYNFRELRAELESLGHSFHTHSDTEVILAAYRAWGESSFPKLRGMFAFALWDAPRQRLLLLRDPMGIKPLYYYRSDQGFLFASEVRTLLQTGLVPRKLDPTGLLTFLAFGSVYEPWTIVEGISAVPPGHIVFLENGSLQTREYWNLLPNPNPTSGPPNPEPLHALPDLLRDAVLSHLVSDVPVGVFLSGGIDSSSLVAVMSHAGVRPATFSLIFREEEFNEAEHSRLVARRFNTDHHEIMVSQEDALSVLPQALRAMDQPTMDGINTWLVSAKTRAAGVKVALTGLGADEMFAGYSNFRNVPRMEKAAARLQRLPSVIRRPVAASVALVAGAGDRSRKLSELAVGGNSLAHPYFLARTLFTPPERKALYAGDCDTAERDMQVPLNASVAASQRLDPVNRVSYLESHWYMRNTLLRDSDFMSMSHALELRVPFLDRSLVEACLQVAGSYKLAHHSPKPLLLASLGVDLPKEIVHRPKRGFTLPFERWLRSEMKPLVERTFLRGASQRDQSQRATFRKNSFRSNAATNSGLSPSAVVEVWNRFQAGQTSWSRPWSLFVLQNWCDENL